MQFVLGVPRGVRCVVRHSRSQRVVGGTAIHRLGRRGRVSHEIGGRRKRSKTVKGRVERLYNQHNLYRLKQNFHPVHVQLRPNLVRRNRKRSDRSGNERDRIRSPTPRHFQTMKFIQAFAFAAAIFAAASGTFPLFRAEPPTFLLSPLGPSQTHASKKNSHQWSRMVPQRRHLVHGSLCFRVPRLRAVPSQRVKHSH